MTTDSKILAYFKSLRIVHLILAVSFVTAGLCVNFVQSVLFVTLKPINARLYRKINYYVTYFLNCFIVYMVEWWSGSEAIIYGDPVMVKKCMGKEHALLLINHNLEIDWLFGWTIFERLGGLGNIRSYCKKVLQYVPIFGWSWKCQEFVFLDRNWEKDRKNLGRQLRALTQYPDPVWLSLFPEGTRFTSDKHAASMKIAAEKGLPLLKHHLLPRTKGFTASIPHLRGKFDAIYDVVMAVEKTCNNPASVVSMMEGKPLKIISLYRRIPMSQVPDDETEAAAWLQKLYQEKDKVLDNYEKYGKFVPEEDRDKEEYKTYQSFETFQLPRRYYTLCIATIWGCIVMMGLSRYFWHVLMSGSVAQILLLVSVCGGGE
ncbi:1-acyl-sn-glycerol-3-phosphate acyltransferase gamma [Folsomia candida]|uniref:1-acyl-sn-glycerol-3-phosphate acyltransferase gamma n=1 Tax=Folsomia candida TaxID=158441 RepID=A0A226DFQ4_FOLCA|nr:1-acyl-sn-glycerol-3-phosphate acyltransferase gamma [Folsomia candida]